MLILLVAPPLFDNSVPLIGIMRCTPGMPSPIIQGKPFPAKEFSPFGRNVSYWSQNVSALSLKNAAKSVPLKPASGRPFSTPITRLAT